MKQKFFEKTIQSDFIKSLLYNTPLPVYNTCRVGDYLIKGISYVYNRQIIKCTQSGYLCNDFKVLQDWFIPSSANDPLLPLVTTGCLMEQGKYYLLGIYNVRYNLTDNDPDYPIFNSSLSYQQGDIVQYYSGSSYLLYEATRNIDAGTLWNYSNWQYIKACERPFMLILCTKSGVLGARPKNGSAYKIIQNFEPLELLSTSNTKLDRHTYYVIQDGTKAQLIYNEDLTYLDQKAAKWKSQATYIPEQYYTKYTNRFISNTDYYDIETHTRLGELLRFYRDLYNLDLMAYYNCFSGANLAGFQIFEDQLTQVNSSQYRLIQVPIKFNKKYTIAIDSPTQVKIIPCLLNLNNFIQLQVGSSNQIILNDLLDNYAVQTYSSLKFNSPIIFECTNTSEDLLSVAEPSVGNSDLLKAELLQRYEKNLYLIIQLEMTVVSSIVVLEGDYTSVDSRKYFNEDNLIQIRPDDLNSMLTSNLSLLKLNDRTTYPFADKLIEYLLYNVISSMDPITENSEKVRQKLSQSIAMWDPTEISWTDYLRILIFDLLMNSNQYQFKPDISGYVDKDAEQFIDTTFR